MKLIPKLLLDSFKRFWGKVFLTKNTYCFFLEDVYHYDFLWKEQSVVFRVTKSHNILSSLFCCHLKLYSCRDVSETCNMACSVEELLHFLLQTTTVPSIIKQSKLNFCMWVIMVQKLDIFYVPMCFSGEKSICSLFTIVNWMSSLTHFHNEDKYTSDYTLF